MNAELATLIATWRERARLNITPPQGSTQWAWKNVGIAQTQCADELSILLTSAPADETPRRAVTSLLEAVALLLPSLDPIQTAAEWVHQRTKESPSAHQESILEDRDDMRRYREARRMVEASLEELRTALAAPAETRPLDSPYAEGTVTRLKHDAEVRDAVIAHLTTRIADLAAETPPRPDRLDLEAIKARHDRDERTYDDIPFGGPVAHQDRGDLIAEVERLRAVGPRPDFELAALLCERWGMRTFSKGVRAHVPDHGQMVEVTPQSLRKLVAALRAVGVPAGEKKDK